MAVKISELSSSISVTSDDFFPIVDSGSATTKKATAEQLLNYVTSSTFNTLTVTTLTGSIITGSTALLTTISGTTITGSTALFNILTGSTITGSTALFDSLTASNVLISNAEFTKINLLVLTGSTITGSTALFNILTGSTITGSNIFFTNISATNVGISGDLSVNGILTAKEYHTQIVSASIIYEDGPTKFGNGPEDTHQFSGSILLSGTLSANNTISGTNAQFTNLTSSNITGSTALFDTLTSSNLNAASIVSSNANITLLTGSTVTGSTALFTILTSSLITASSVLFTETTSSFVTGSTALFSTVTGSTITGSIAKFTTISSSNINVSGNLILEGETTITSYPDYSYIIYTASYDKLVIFPGLYVSGNLTGSALGAFQTVTASIGEIAQITGSMYFSASNASHWTGAAPTNIENAINRIAAAIYNGLSGSIA